MEAAQVYKIVARSEKYKSEPTGQVGKVEHIFIKEASLFGIQKDRGGLPEAQLRCWLAQFLCNLFLQLLVRCVHGDR